MSQPRFWSVSGARLAEQLGLDPGALCGYGKRAHTRSDHLNKVARYLGWKTAAAGSREMKELEQFLLDRAMEHDSPTLLFNLGREYLMSAKVIRPGALTLAKMVGTARAGAAELTSQKVAHLLTSQVRQDLDLWLADDIGLGMSRLAWLSIPAVDATASAVKTSIEKLTWLRSMDAPLLDLSMLPNERRRFLATVGRRSTVQGLQRRMERRYPILLALVAQSAVDQLDEVVALFDQAVSARESRAKTKTDEALVERAKKGEDRQLLVDVILPVLADPSIPDEQVGGILRNTIGMQRLREVMAGPWKPLPKDHGRLSAMAASYTYLRQFTPHVLGAIDFKGGPGTTDLMAAVTMLKRLNETGGRKVPADAPDSFVPTRYAGYLAKARKSGDDTAYRHYWELCVILGLHPRGTRLCRVDTFPAVRPRLQRSIDALRSVMLDSIAWLVNQASSSSELALVASPRPSNCTGAGSPTSRFWRRPARWVAPGFITPIQAPHATSPASCTPSATPRDATGRGCVPRKPRSSATSARSPVVTASTR